MNDIAVQEHVREERIALRHGNRIVRPVRGAAEDAHLKQFRWNDREARRGRLSAAPGLPQEGRDVYCDQADRDPLKANGAQRVVV